MGKKQDTGVPQVGRPRGFAALALTEEGREKIREVARLGGIAAHRTGRAHEFTTEEARAAGRLGGRASQLAAKARKAAAEG